MSRREFPAKVRVDAFKRAKGRCEKCTARLFVGKFAYDHVISDAMGGEPILENCEVLCSACHGIKTAVDVAQIAKAKRQERGNLGVRATRNPMPGSKASGWRKRMNGTAERRT